MDGHKKYLIFFWDEARSLERFLSSQLALMQHVLMSDLLMQIY